MKRIPVIKFQRDKYGDELLVDVVTLDAIRKKVVETGAEFGAAFDGDADRCGFVDNEGNSLADKDFYIRCQLDYGDTLSYQDSFKWYDKSEGLAYNYEYSNDCIKLDDTMETLERPYDDHTGQVWSRYNDVWIDEEDAVWVPLRNDYAYSYQVCDAYISEFLSSTEICLDDDCVTIGNEKYYCGENAEDYEEYGIIKCDYCCDYYLSRGALYSDLTEKYYCCESCREDAEKTYKRSNGWTLATWNDKYFENEEDVLIVYRWCKAYSWSSYPAHYEKITIGRDDFNELCEFGEACFCDGRGFIDEVLNDGTPAHYAAAELQVA